MNDLIINPRVTIPASELEVQFARSGGPGGQNVNKVNTKVTMRWKLRESTILPEPWVMRLRQRFKNRINLEGDFVVHSERYRVQHRNLEDCREKIREMVLSCQFPPTPRKKTKPSYGSQLRRLDEKKRAGQKKRLRRPPFSE